MNLTKIELELIRSAKETASKARFVTIVLLTIVGIAFVAFFSDIITSVYFVGICVVASIASILVPQFGGPKYQELVALLVKVEENSGAVEKDPIVEALSKKS